MSEEHEDIPTTGSDLGTFASMTSQTLLELIARASTLTLKQVVKSARIPPEQLLELLKILADEKLVTVEGVDTLSALAHIVHEMGQSAVLPTGSSAEQDHLVCGVPNSVIERRRELIQHLPDDLRPRRITVTRKGFGKAFAL